MSKSRNWRRAYHETVERYIRSWREWRHTAPSTKIRTPQFLRNYTAGEMREWTDDQLRDFAHEVASKDMEIAINQHNASIPTSRYRAGVAQ